MTRLLFVAHLLLLCLVGSALASAASNRLPRPALIAAELAAPPILDGEVLEDAVWRTVATAADTFWQVRPQTGEPASERTEVRVGFTAAALYVGVVCFDRDSSAIIVSDSRRDASLEDTDSFQLVLDTFRDEQNGFVFGTNPAGIEYDGQVKNSGDGGFGGGGGRFRRGSGGGFNLNWDGAWQVRTKLGAFGWSAELAIPFSTLRYPSVVEPQVWGINFQRNIRRHNETAFWAPLDRQFNLYRLSDAGTLENVAPAAARNLQLTPYALWQGQRAADAAAGTERDRDWGVDLKYSLTAALTLDATYNTDFAQVEVDEEQVNLDRFNLFFPEKRPFFLENAGLFSVGSPGSVDLFFSRRVGIGEGGEEIPIRGGLRLTGKIAPRTNLGLLAMQTEAVAGVAPSNDYGVARLTRELPNRSFVGALLVRRQASGSGAASDDENDTLAVDGALGVGDYMTLSGFVARTDTPGLDGRAHALRFNANYSSPDWFWFAGYSEVGEAFNPEVGFLARSAYRSPSATVLRRLHPKQLLGLYELRPHISYNGFWNFAGFQETGFLHLDNHWEWRGGAELHTGYNLTREGLREPFEIATGVVVPPGTYDHSEAQLVVQTNAGASVSFSMTGLVGGFFGGDRLGFNSTLRLRRGEMLTSEIGWNHNRVDLPWGQFETNLGRLRVSYSITTELLLQVLVQYNDQSDRVSTNLRFSWLHRANTGLFVVYNEVSEIGALAAARPGRELILKYSRLIDVLR